MQARTDEKKTAALAVVVFFFALALRLRGLGTLYPVNDEFMQFYEALSPSGWGRFFELLSHNPHHALLDPLSTYVAALISPSLWAMRIPSALAGALGCWLLCRLGAREGRPRTGLIAGLLLSVSLLHLDWSRRADFYALLTAVSLWTAVDYLDVLDHPDRWPKLSLSASVFLLSHPYAVLMLIFQVGHCWITRRGAFETVTKSWGTALLVFSPWFLYSTKALLDLSLFDFRRNPAVLGFGAFLSGLPSALAQRPEAGAIPPVLAAFFAGAYALGWGVSLTALSGPRRSRLIVFAHAVLAFGLLAVVAADLRYHYYLAHRQLLWVLPFYLLAVVDGWSILLSQPRFRRAAVAAAVLGALPLWASVTRWQEARADGMANLVATVDRVAKAGAPFAFENDQLAAGFLWTYDRDAFRRIPDMRLIHGMMTYDFPPGFFVRGGHPVTAGAACGPRAGAWTFCGTVYETGVLPPTDGLP